MRIFSQFSKVSTLLLLVGLFSSTAALGQSQNVQVVNNENGWTINVDGQPLMVNGMNWDYFPRGTNYSYSLWNQPPDFIKQALDYEMGLLQNMGVNAIRVYTGIQPEWITYIYENYGIYTMLNHSFGRYGLTIDGSWIQNTDYSDPRTRELLFQEVTEMVEVYQDVDGVLLFLLGNENNYGLFWEGAETEDIPVEDRASTAKAREMYKTFNDAIIRMKRIATNRPIAICNGDLQFLDLIAELTPDMDIFGTNTYRGISFTDLYDRVRDEFGKPVLLTEFGADAYNALRLQEDQGAQAFYQKGNWFDIYENAPGLGGADNSIGGFTFQFSDGWWKYGQVRNLDEHDVNASWPNGGYTFDFKEGSNNMNEEWFGITAKGPTTVQGTYELFPRAAYYVLKDVHTFDPLAPGTTIEDLRNHFDGVSLQAAVLAARGDKAALQSPEGAKIRLSRFTADIRTYNTDSDLSTTPDDPVPGANVFPNQNGFDNLQSFYAGFAAKPAPNMRAEVTVNVLGNVPLNPIDEVFFENRGRPVVLEGNEEQVTLFDNNRVFIYNSSYTWVNEYFEMEGFYRTGHYHWANEGDFFNLYLEANYGPNIDIYNGFAPFGFEMAGKKQFKDFKFAFGPELWWGANPGFLLKYEKELNRKTKFAAVWHEDIQQVGNVNSSFAIPLPKTRRVSAYLHRELSQKLDVEVGGLWGGSPLIGRNFQLAREQSDGTTRVFEDQIAREDNWGGKFKVTYAGGKFNWYAQSAVMGLVANGGFDQTLTFTGWRLKDSGSGNQYNFLSGFTYNPSLFNGKVQIAPNFLWQQPIEGPVPADAGGAARSRNFLDDPFAVRANREQVAGEILFTFDPTPGTFMYEWDNDRAEDAEFAFSLGLVYRHLPTIQDAAIGIFGDGRTFFAFPESAPAEDLWEVNARIVSKPTRDFGFIATIYGGTAQANGSDDRLIERFGVDSRVIYKKVKMNWFVRFNDWGPFDFHRDFNQTFPLQLMADVSTTLGTPDWFDIPTTRFGIRGNWRSMDQFSPRYAPVREFDPSGAFLPNPEAIGFDNGFEWEIRTYIQIDIRN